LIVPDRTVYIAGLMKTSRSSERNRGIPWISEIPVLNWFLTNKSRRNDETELVFLIKPEIMRPNRNLAPAPLGITSPGEAGGAR
jgi:type II secretory pathway component GspD/PulD (secretin)